MPLVPTERENWDFFLNLPNPDRTKLKTNVKGTQFLEPLFEFSGACPGCGETPYIKLMTQLVGDRTMIANATGWSSIYGGNLPTTPYSTNSDGRGPAWSNSLFEDNAEFGMGYRLSINKLTEEAHMLTGQLAETIGQDLADALLSQQGTEEQDFIDQRARIETLRAKLASDTSEAAVRLCDLADYLVEKSIWIVGGDGWAYL